MRLLPILAFCMLSPTVYAEILPLPPSDIDLVGGIKTTQSVKGDTLLDIARRFDFGQDEILYANPEVDRWLPKLGSEVVLPSRYILPDAPRSGVVLNLPEMRLFYYDLPIDEVNGVKQVLTHPVSVGRMDWDTPLGTTRIIAKKIDPTWTPPESIRREAEANGEPLPAVVAAGPDNPLGRYAMRLGIPGYLIHSTNKPYGVGMRVTHGCVRMYPEDIETFFSTVPVNTTVTLVNQPIKVGWYGDRLYIEIHPPLEEQPFSDEQLLDSAIELVKQKIGTTRVAIRWSLLKQAVATRNGIPQIISREEII